MCTDDSPAGLAAVGHHEIEPAVEIALEPVDSVVVTTLMDNVTDSLMTDQGPARRFGFGRGPSRPSALMEAEQVPDALIAEHGFSVLVVPAHCTGWRAQHAMSARFPAAYVPNAVGTSFQL